MKQLLWVLMYLLPNFLLAQGIAPGNIAGLNLWLKADSVNITNGKVDIWHDKMGNNALQPIVSQQPTFVDSAINNHPVIRFNGALERLVGTNPISGFNNSSFTIFIVSSGGFVSNQTIECIFTVNNYSDGFWLARRSFTSEQFLTSYNNGLNSITSSVNSLPNGGYPARLITYKKNINVNSKLYLNGANHATSTDAALCGAFTNTNYSIGQSGFGFSSLTGDIAEIIVYNSVLNDSVQSGIEKYLKTKYAPPIQLPSDITSTSFCDTTLIPLNPNKNQYSYLWSTGATTSTISVNKPGKYWVNATNIFGEISSDTINVIYPAVNQFNDSMFCNGNTIVWNTNLSKDQFSFLWQDNTSTDSLFSISQAGDYHVKISDNFGCFIESDTITATLDNFSTTASLGPDANLCAGNAIYLKAGNQPGLNYTWNDGTHNDSLYINTSGQYFATITNTNNCVAKDTINVTIIGQAPTASFLNSIACKSNSVSFIDNSTPPGGNTISSWFWNFGDVTTLADTSILQNPFYTYTDTGNHIIQLTINTNAGCKQTFNKIIHVAPKPTANFNNLIACQNDSAIFTNLSSTATGYNPLTYLWNFGDPASGGANTSTLTHPKHLFTQQVNHTVKLVATNNAGCKDSLSKNILVKAQVTANFTYNTPCTNAPIIFQDNSIVPLPDNLNTRMWTIGTSTTTGLSATKSFTAAGIYTVTLKVIGLNGCISTNSKQIDVKLPPVAQFTLNSICYGDTGTAIDNSNPQNGFVNSWNWKLDNVIISTTSTATLAPPATANYNLKLTVANSFGCKDSISKVFTVYPLPAVDFTYTPSSYIYPNLPVVFGPAASSGIFYSWNINGTPYSVYSPTVSFPAAGTYTASFYLKNTYGCGNTRTKTISVLGYQVDLALLEVRTSKSDDGFITVEADLGNFGSAPITNFEINYEIADAASIKENWQGNLLPGGYLGYIFNSKAIQKNTQETFITCVNIGLVNHINDFNQNNNKLCVPSDLNEIKVYEPYPNPSEESTSISVVLPNDAEISINLSDELGQAVYDDQTIAGKQGLNLLTIPTSGLSKATYILKITIGDKIFIKKLLKAKQ